MEGSRALEFKNASLKSNFMRHFSSLNKKGSCPPKNDRMEHYQRNASGNSRHRPGRATRNTLPKNATNILKDWLLINWHDPYPMEEEKYSLAKATGLKMEQVNNWLINARRRLLPGICLKYGLDHSKCKIVKRGGNRGLVLGRPQTHDRDLACPPGEWSKIPRMEMAQIIDKFSQSLSGLVSPSAPLVDEAGQVSSSNVTYNIVLENPEHPTMLDYLADVMLVNEELEKQPNKEGLSRLELLCKRGLAERLYPFSP